MNIGGGLYRHWSLPAAVWDPHGYWGPAGNYLVVDDPFYTYGISTSVPVSPVTTHVSTPDVYYGMYKIKVDNEQVFYSSLLTMRMARLNSSNVEVGDHYIGPPAQAALLNFGKMRHFVFARNGRYLLTLPGETLPSTGLNFRLLNAYRSTDTVLIGLPWSGSVPAGGRVESGDYVNPATGVAQGVMRVFSRTGNSIADVLADPTGSVIWQDTANNTVWMKHVGGLVWPANSGHPDSRDNLARSQNVFIVPTP